MRVLIVGLGLIGGSLAAALTRGGWEVGGTDAVPGRIRRARELGFISREEPDFLRAVSAYDVIVLATPVRTIRTLLESLRTARLRPGAVITDVGSTKAGIVRLAEEVFRDRGVYFVGGHPMAGSHKAGLEAAHADLFENAYYVLCPAAGTPEGALALVREVLAPTRAKLVTMDPDVHDRVVGLISHLPHVVAAILVHMVLERRNESDWYYYLAAGGFKDLTRIAEGDPAMWRDILLENREVVAAYLEEIARRAETLARLLRNADDFGQGENFEGDLEGTADVEEFLYRFFSEASRYRRALPEKRRGAIHPLFELYARIADRPGEIGRLTTLLGEHGINLTNLEIFELREDVWGILRLAFRNESDLLRAHEVLQEAGYDVEFPR
ncbi:prephenate dehydrogenase [Brockia lithotrophica]|uniref:prephenate dehydrogenase n=1 Tax=Brockia lithotrophica TaxID=933949 RepID=UPI001FEB7A47|nr:prephenate dehydrogenase [Brockia lithotrophica]